ncbi:753_t:CDS:10 [Ambispora gerdemannii]|uniref:Pre-rRNA-processing protein RIX1 n=1 Tax=Ambispora gerdemannii TaxID=144530 RepID=A0A9N8UYN3_9GLOM|nr:753_t:CDS:10 [Ambispora gerdemannii]
MATQQRAPELILHSLLVNYLSKEDSIEPNIPFLLETITFHQLLSSGGGSSGSGKSDSNNNSAEKINPPLHKWCTRVNSLLSSKTQSARWAGVCFVKVSIEQSWLLFTENFSLWSTTLLSLLVRPEPVTTLKVIISTLSEMFSKTVDRLELQREVTSQLLPRFNSCLINLSGTKDLLRFPSMFRPILQNAQNLCLSVFDNNDENYDSDSEVVKKAAKCFANICNAGGKIGASEQWRLSLIWLVGSTHVILDRLFDTVDEENKFAKKQQPQPPGQHQFEFPKVTDDYIVGFPILFKRFRILCQFIVSMLRNLSSTNLASVQVPVNLFMELICRVCNVCDGVIGSDHKDKNEFSTLLIGLPALHLAINRVLGSLILCLVRASIYNLFNLCIQKYRNGFLLSSSSASSLIFNIIEDLTINEITATKIDSNNAEAVNSIKGSSKKKKSRITNSDTMIIGAQTVLEQSNIDLQIAALEVLKTSLSTTGGSSIPPTSRTLLDNLLLSRILDNNIKTKTNAKIKLKLYECLLASIIAPSEYQANILPYALRIYKSGFNDDCFEIQSFCSYALTICDLIYHSRLPPIQRSVPSTRLFDKPSSNLKVSSDLESLGINNKSNEITNEKTEKHKQNTAIATNSSSIEITSNIQQLSQWGGQQSSSESKLPDISIGESRKQDNPVSLVETLSLPEQPHLVDFFAEKVSSNVSIQVESSFETQNITNEVSSSAPSTNDTTSNTNTTKPSSEKKRLFPSEFEDASQQRFKTGKTRESRASSIAPVPPL